MSWLGCRVPRVPEPITRIIIQEHPETSILRSIGSGFIMYKMIQNLQKTRRKAFILRNFDLAYVLQGPRQVKTTNGRPGHHSKGIQGWETCWKQVSPSHRPMYALMSGMVMYVYSYMTIIDNYIVYIYTHKIITHKNLSKFQRLMSRSLKLLDNL